MKATIIFIMNLLTKKSGLLFVLAALVIFSCKKEPSRIGDSLQPPDIQTDLSFNDSLKAQTSTVLVNDSIITSNDPANKAPNNVYGLVGQSKDPIFGRITSKTFAQLRYNVSGSFSFGDNPVFDSAVFSLIPNGFYGDTTPAAHVDQSISVYQLTGSIDTNTIYRATSPEIPYDLSKKLATFNFPANQTEPSSISVRLTDENFAKGIIENGITSDTALLRYCKGIALVAENKDAVVRRFYLYPTTTAFSGIKIYYHNDKNFSSIVLNFIYKNPKFYTIEADRSGTPIAGLGNQSYGAEITGNLSYVQAGTGVMTKLSFPGLEKFLKEMKAGEQIIINKAEIVVKVDQASAIGYPPIPRLDLYQTGENGKMAKIGNASAAVQANGYYLFGTAYPGTSYYDQTNKLYKFSIGSYLQAVADGKIVLRPLLISASETILVSSTASEGGPLNFYSLYRSVLKNDTSIEADRIKLNIYYTIVK